MRTLFLSCSLIGLLAVTGCGGNSNSKDKGKKAGGKQAKEPHYELAEEHREFLWSLEHHNNILMQVGFARLGSAIRKGDPKLIEEQLDTKFSAKVAKDSQRADLVGTKQFSAHRIEWAGDPDSGSSMSAANFAKSLVQGRARFGEEFRIQFGVTTIAPLDRKKPDDRWSAVCRIRQFGKSKEGGFLELITNARLTMRRPDKVRMRSESWLIDWTTLSATESNAKQILMKEVADAAGFDVAALHDNWRDRAKIQGTGGVYACDFNNDACTDLLISDVNGTKLYQGSVKGQYKDVTLQLGLIFESNDIRPVFVDIDNDGWQDLVLADGTIFRNQKGKGFRQQRKTNLGRVIKIATVDSSITGISTADYDRDGRMDLYIIRNGSRPTSWLKETSNSEGNQLLKNLGNWQFEDVTERTKVGGEGRSVFAVVWLDANSDSWPDFFIINEYGNGGLYLNNEGKSFTEQKLIEGPGDFGSMGVTAGDINNDGHIDIFLASMYSKAGSRVITNIPPGVYPPKVMARLKRFVTGSELYMNDGKLKFAPKGRKFQVHDAGWTWGPALADLNGDGFLDIFSTAGYMSRDRNKPDG